MRHVQGSVEGEWTFVSVKHPCRICGGHEGCRRGFDDSFACCVRRASDWPLTTGGWVHRLQAPTSHRVVRLHPGAATREEAADAVRVAS
jgi:hypothetical protein